MFKKIYLLLVCLSISSISIAETVTLNADRPDQYVVQKGDTLWDISAQFLQEPWYWPTIWDVNPQIENPHLIYPGDVVSLTFKDGQPMLTVNGMGRVVMVVMLNYRPRYALMREMMPFNQFLLMQFSSF